MILITGANGQLGQCLKTLFQDAATYVDIDTCDITDLESLEKTLSRVRPKIVINCAAFTHVDKCEAEQELSQKVNAQGPENLAKLSAKYDFSLIHISTDYVFDGSKNTPYKEDDATTPNSVYGKGKLAGEKAIIKNTERHIIIRTSWLYSEFANNFVKNIKSLMESRESLGIVYDQVGSPTYAMDLAAGIKHIIDSDNINKYGVYHFGNQGVASWYDLTKEIQKYFSVNCDIKPIETFEYPLPAKRPHYSVFNTRKFQETFNYKIPYWKESLEICLQKL